LLDTIALGANDARPPPLSRHAAGNVALCEGVAVDCGDGARQVASATIENDRTARDVAVIDTRGSEANVALVAEMGGW
jgi:hypothetical protein